jgi:phage/plasmid-associated DNA primase
MFDNFKSYTTDDQIEVDEKYQNPKNVQNNNNFVILSNNDQPVKIESNDSRFVLFDCNESKAGDNKYFEYLSKFLDQETADEFFTYIINRDHVGHVLNQPKSEYYHEVQELSLNNCIRFVQHCREQVYKEEDNSTEANLLDWNGTACKDDKSVIYINRTKLYNGYTIWCKESGEKPCKAALFYKIITQSDCGSRIVCGDRQIIMKNMMLYSQN